MTRRSWLHLAVLPAPTGIYGVLNACRVLAYLDGQGVLSKAEAADWAREHLPAAHRPTITRALEAYRAGSVEPCAPQEVRELTRWAAARALEHEAQAESLPAVTGLRQSRRRGA